MVDLADLRPPFFLPGVRIDRDRLSVERVEEHEAVLVRGAAVDDVAARDALRCRRDGRLVRPLRRRARLREIESVEIVRVGRDNVHRVADDDRRRLMAAGQSGRERERESELARVRGRDLIEGAVSRARKVFRRAFPEAVVGRNPARKTGFPASRRGLLFHGEDAAGLGAAGRREDGHEERQRHQPTKCG
jgi:hypothetical protein